MLIAKVSAAYSILICFFNLTVCLQVWNVHCKVPKFVSKFVIMIYDDKGLQGVIC